MMQRTAGLLSEAPGALYSFFSDVKSACSEVAAAFSSTFDSPETRTAIHKTSMEGWQGFSQPFSSSVVLAIFRSSDTRKTLSDSISANVLYYMAPVILYHAGIKPGLRMVYGEGTYVEAALDMAATLYFLRLAANRYNDNIYYNSLLAKDVTEKNHEESGMEPCGCEDVDIVKARLTNGIYYVGNILAIHCIASSIPYGIGDLIHLPLTAYLYGQNLLGYKISAIGNCAKHHNEIIVRNNAYAFGMGTAYLMSVNTGYYLTRYVTGVDSPFIYDAFAWIMWQASMMSSLLIDKPLPGKKEGTEIFYHGRLVTEAVMRQVTEDIIPAILRKKPGYDWITAMQNLMSTPVMKVISHFCLDKDFRSLDLYLKRPAVRRFLRVNRKDIEGTYNYLLALRHDRIKTIGLYLPDFLVSAQSKKILGFIKSEEMFDIFSSLNELLNRIYPGREKGADAVLRFFDMPALKDEANLQVDNFIGGSRRPPVRNKSAVLEDQNSLLNPEEEKLLARFEY